jgi:hypothetical protein
MKFVENISMWSLSDLAETAFAIAFLSAWLICCAVVAFLLRIIAVLDSSSNRFLSGNNARNHGSFIRRYCRKQLLESKSFLAEVPEALGI